MLKTSREKVVQNAEKYVSRGKIESGIKEYRKLLDENPNDISTLNRVGDLYARINRNSEAIELFHQIAEQYAEDGFLVKAIAIYKKIIKLDPTLLEIYEQLADLYHRQGLVNEARTQYQVLADYYIKHNKPASAIHVYERMVELEEDNPTHHVKLAELYQKEGMLDQAMGEYRAIAELMLEHGRGEEAAQVYERGLAVTSEDIGFITDGVLKLKEAGHVAAAARFLALAVERNPQAERVARIAGLSEQTATGITGTGVAVAEPPAEESPAELSTEEVAAGDLGVEEEAPPEALGSIETAVGTDTGSGVLDVSEEAPEEIGLAADTVAEAAVPQPDQPDQPDQPEQPYELEQGFADQDLSELELDLDDDEPASLVQPPPDMLEDRERRGAAWGGDDEAPAAESATSADAAAPEETGTGAEVPAGTSSGTGTFEFELDLDVDGEELLELAPGDGAGVDEERDTTIDIDHDLLERTAAEVHAEPSSGPDDLFTEAEVLSRYGIQEKALERLAELLQREPDHLAAYAMMVGIHLDAGRHDRAAAVAGSMLEVAAEQGDQDHWPEIAGRLEAAGHRINGLRVTPPEGAGTDDESTRPTELEADLDAGEAASALVVEDEATFEIEEAERAEEVEAPGEIYAAEPAADEVRAAGAEVEIELDEDRFELPDLPEPAPESEPPAEASASAAEALPEEPATPAERPRRRVSKVDAALEELAGLAGRLTKRRSRRAPTEPVASPEPPVPPPVEAPTVPPAEAAPPAEATPAAAAAAAGSADVDPLRALGDSLREEIDLSAEEVAPAAGEADFAAEEADLAAGHADSSAEPVDAAAAAGNGGQSLDDTGMSWLDEVPQPAEGKDLFAGEADFFDLGAELEQELTQEESLETEDELLLTNSEQSLEDIVEGFKRGVAENLSSEDYDTHFNLGIAYREMGLLDEAIGEFQLASKHPDYLVSCASMLGLCFLEKGLPELAVKWYSRGLESPEISEEDQLGLLYDLGNAQAAAGDSETAYHTFVDLYGINTNYRDVVARLAELEPR